MVTTRPAAIQADYCNFKRVRGRRVLVLEVEIPLEREREVFDVLGFPDPAVGCPIAIALLDPARLNENAPGTKPEAFRAVTRPDRNAEVREPQADDTTSDRPRKRWSELSRAQQAGIRCNDPQFRDFLSSAWSSWHGDAADDPAAFVREICGVASRAELDRNDKAARAWDSLDAEFQEWAGYMPEDRS